MLKTPTITVQRSFRRTLALQIESDGTVLVKAPRFLPDGEVHRFVQSHSGWIEKRLKKLDVTRQARVNDQYLFLGVQHKLTLGNYQQISLKDGKLLFPHALLFRKEKELANWYISQARLIITKQVEKYAKEMGTCYKAITFSDTRSQWGRCTHDNRLQFSWRLVMAPLLVLNYVVIHELSHTIEKNHTRAFWAKVRLYNPSYRQQLKWLKDYGSMLKIT